MRVAFPFLITIAICYTSLTRVIVLSNYLTTLLVLVEPSL